MSDAHHDEIAKLEALHADHPEGRVFTHLAEAYRKAGRLERAREILAEGLERHPDYPSAHVVFGRVLSDQGHTDEADAEFRRVLELDSHNMVALRALADSADERGDREAARSYYERLADLEPSEEVRERLRQLSEPEEELEGRPEHEPGPEGMVTGYGTSEATGEWAGAPAEEPDATRGAGGEEDAETTVWEAQGDLEPSHESDAAFVPGGSLEHGEPAVDAEEAERQDEELLDLEGTLGYGEPEEPEGSEGSEDFERAEPEGAVPGQQLERSVPWSTELADEGRAEEESPEEGPPEEPVADEGSVTTETIAQVYARQGLYDRAADVYRQLLRGRPDDEGLRERLREMEQLAAQQERPDEEDVAVSGLQDLEVDERLVPGFDEGATAGDAAERAGAGDLEVEGFVSQETALEAEVEPLEGLERDEKDAETGLVVEATPPADTSDRGDALDVTEVPPPPEEREEVEAGGVFDPSAADVAPGGAEEDESEEAVEESVWSGEGITAGAAAEATPHAWAESGEEVRAEPGPAGRPEDEGIEQGETESGGPPIREYFTGLLSWSQPVPGETGAVAADRGTATARTGAEAGEVATGEPATTGEPGEALASPEEPGRPSEEGEDDDLEMFRSWLESLKQ